MAGWQDDPLVGVAPPAATGAPAAPASQPAWMSDPVVPDSPAAATAPAEPTGSAFYHALRQKSVDPAMRQKVADDALEIGNGVVPAALRGFTYGLADKAGAAVDASVAKLFPGFGEKLGIPREQAGQPFGDIYQSRLQGYRDQSDVFAKKHPIAAPLAYGVGTLASLPFLPELSAATVPGRIAQGAGVGAGVGAAAGLAGTNDESVTQDLTAAGLGAGAGAVTGGGLAAAGELVAKPIIDWFGRKFGGDAAANNQALKIIVDKMKQDKAGGGPSAQDMLDLINSGGGKPLAIADVAGENTKALGGTIARQQGPGQNVVKSFLNERDAGAGTRLSGDVNAGISNGGSLFDTAQALDDARKSAAKPFYETAYQANNAITSPEIDRILATPAGKKAFATAKELMANDGVPVTSVGPNKLETLDYVKRALDDQIGAARRAGANNEARILTKNKNDLLAAIDNADVTAERGTDNAITRPGQYKLARQAYSGPSQSMDSLEFGSKFLTKSPSEIAHDVAGMESGDLEFYKLGAADALRTKIAKTGAAGNEAKELVGNDYIKQQLRPLFDSDAAYQKFIAAATAEGKMFETRFNTIGGSHTAGRAAADAGGGKPVLGPLVTAAASTLAGEPFAAVPSAGRGIANLLGRLGTANNPKVSEAAARVLFNSAPDQNARNLALLMHMLKAKRSVPLITAPAATVAPNTAAYLGIPPWSTPSGQ